jgi:tryptophan-rich sensory protein
VKSGGILVSLSSFLVLIGFIAACTLAALSGAIFRPGAWYERLAKPAWRPPNWLFAGMEPALSDDRGVRAAGQARGGISAPLAVLALQFGLNAAWTPVFFGLHRIGLGFAIICLLWLATAATIAVFYPVSPTAALLLSPYLAWVGFAAALNYAVWGLNRSVPSP